MDKKIKILFAINKLTIGGAETVVVSQINNIDKNKFDVYLGLLYQTDKISTLYDQLKIDQTKIIHFNYKKLFDFKGFIRTYKFLKDNKIEVVISNLFETNTALRLAAILSRAKIIIITEHSCYFNKSRWQIVIDHILAYFTDIIFAVSPEVAEFTAKQEKINFKKIKVLKQISDLSLIGDFKRQDLRHKFGIKEDGLAVMTIGRFSPEKAQYRIIETADLIVKKGINNIYFLLVGYGRLENQLKEMIISKGLEKNVKIIIDPKKAKEYLVAGDIFLLTSNREGMPVSMLEAMSAGLACIASDVGGIKDILKNEINGYLLKTGDIEAMANKIIDLKNDPAKLNLMKQASKMLAEKNSGDIKIFEQIIETLYKNKR